MDKKEKNLYVYNGVQIRTDPDQTDPELDPDLVFLSLIHWSETLYWYV